MIFFSIIIPVRAVNDFIKESVSYLKKLDYPSFEVIIVTDEDEDNVFKDSRFHMISSGPVGPGEKRNLGASESAGGVLAFLDDDAYPEEDWLLKAQRIFEDFPDLCALGAPAVTPRSSTFLERLSGRIYESFLTGGNTVYRYLPKKRREIDDYPTVNLFVRKDAFNKVGGFPIEFWPGEDTKLCLDLVNISGKKFIYDPAPIVYHHRRKIFLPHLKQVSRYGQHRGQFARIFPKTSRLPFYFVPSLFVLGLFLGPLLSFFVPSLWGMYFFAVGLYLILLTIESIRISILEKNPLAFPYATVGIFLTHLVYGVNFIWGYIKKPSLKLRGVDDLSGNYLGG